MALFDPERHEPLLDEPWNPDAIEAAIRDIVAEAEVAFDDGWPAHPQDEVEPRRFGTLYLGGAGVIRALDELERRGLVELGRDYVPYLERDYVPDFPEHDHERSLLMGETGIRLVRQRLSPASANTDRLAELIRANAHDERRELMWGSPGTMLAAAELHRATGEPRWADLWRESASWLLDESDPESGIWTQELYGSTTRYLGPAHGFAGCMLALAAFPPVTANVHERAAAVTRRYAVEEDRLANWPPLAGMPLRTRDGQIRVQWCHGAPGIVASLAALAPDDSEHERLLCAGGELTWRAGPLAKGAGLCHGTAGNGYAFLALLERTSDELWLERARSFAVHAAAQVARERAAHGHGRFTLWTGDLGTALYLADCLAGGGTLPLP
jgi:Lanthionine synthetase C-like protein